MTYMSLPFLNDIGSEPIASSMSKCFSSFVSTVLQSEAISDLACDPWNIFN